MTLNSVSPTSVLDLLKPLETDMGAALIGCTVMRMRGKFMVVSDDATPDEAIYTYAVGAQPSTALIVEGGIAAADDDRISPVGTPGRHNDWMWYEPVLVLNSADPDLALAHVEFDVRSRRKVDELGQGIALVFGAGTPGLASGHTATFQGVISTLIALP